MTHPQGGRNWDKVIFQLVEHLFRNGLTEHTYCSLIKYYTQSIDFGRPEGPNIIAPCETWG
jgi:hypothetical protein